MRLMLPTEKPQLPLQSKKLQGLNTDENWRHAWEPTSNLQQLTRTGRSEAGAQNYIYKEHMLDINLLHLGYLYHVEKGCLMFWPVSISWQMRLFPSCLSHMAAPLLA